MKTIKGEARRFAEVTSQKTRSGRWSWKLRKPEPTKMTARRCIWRVDSRYRQTTDVQRILDSTPIKDLVEFSRAIHAEADAIVSLARAGGPSCRRASLYVNVYPCHLHRQIIAAGIAEVVYIEPYPKALRPSCTMTPSSIEAKSIHRKG